MLGRGTEQVVFTSGGTEANLLGVRALAAGVVARGLPRVVAAAFLALARLRGIQSAASGNHAEAFYCRKLVMGL